MLDGLPSGKYQAGAVAQPNVGLAGHGSVASIPGTGQIRQNQGGSRLLMVYQSQSIEQDSERDKENKFHFNPRMSKYGQGFMPG